MKCSSCGGELARPTSPCPYCESRPEVDLRDVNHRDLGPARGLACPRCQGALETRRLELGPPRAPLDIDRCLECRGVFFNPGELERFLHIEIAWTVWLDLDRLGALGADAATASSEARGNRRHYLPCPACGEIMTSLNFGRKSGVLIDRCRAHGAWLDGGELRQIAEWWHAGGKHLHQAHEQERAKTLLSNPAPRLKDRRTPSRTTGAEAAGAARPDANDAVTPIFDLVGGLAGRFFD